MHDEGVQILENLANVRVPVIAAIEGRAHVHSEYALLANVIVAGEGATFHDLPHFAGGIVPGDGIFIDVSQIIKARTLQKITHGGVRYPYGGIFILCHEYIISF